MNAIVTSAKSGAVSVRRGDRAIALRQGQPTVGIGVAPGFQNVGLRHLLTLEVAVDALESIGAAPNLERRVGPIVAGRFEGRRVSGVVRPGGADWQTIGADGATHLDARIVLETTAGELIGMTFGGMRHGPPQVMDRLARGEPVDPAEYYFRVYATFSAGAVPLSWLNRIIAVGTGHRLPGSPVYNIFEVI